MHKIEYTMTIRDVLERAFQGVMQTHKDVKDLTNEEDVKKFSNYYLAKSHYLWSIPERYGIYIHCGLSLMEYLCPC